jgi:AcrR family transcriptional regulator
VAVIGIDPRGAFQPSRYSLDDKRQKVPENDIPDVLDCWNHRRDAKFQQKRAQRLADLQKQIAPLKKDRLEHHAIIHRLKFEEVVSKTTDKARAAENRGGPEVPSETRSQGTNGNKRSQIVDKAVELFNRFGYGSVRISDITDAVHIGKGTLYLYFKSKKGLLLECFRRLDLLIFTLEQSDDVCTAEGFFGRMPQRLAGVLSQYDWFAGINNLIKASVGSDDPEISTRAKQSYRTIIEPLKKDLEIAIQNGDARSTDAELAVYGLIGFADGVNFRVALDNRYRPQQVVDFLSEFVDHAFRSTTTQQSVAGDLSAVITDQNGVCTEVE